MGIFDGLPVPPDKEYLREELLKIDESWATARFDSLPHVVHILTSKDRERELHFLKEQRDIVEDVVDEVVQAYHGGFNKAIQNYSQILRLFSESSESIGTLKVDLTEAKKRLGTRNKQLHQLWYRSVTLRHIIALLDQIESISKVPSRIEKLIAEKQFYAAIQSLVQSSLMLEREGLQTVGALQDVKSELSKLRGLLFYRIVEDLHAHLYNKGEHSSVASTMDEREDELPTITAAAYTMTGSQSLSRRTRMMKGEHHGHTDGSLSSSLEGHDEDGELHDEASSDGHARGDGITKDNKAVSRHIPSWLSNSTPDEFIETIKKSDAPLHVKYLQTLVECLYMLGKVAASGAMIWSGIGQATETDSTGLHFIKVQVESFQLSKKKHQNGISLAGTLLQVSPVSPVMAPTGKAQTAARDLLDSVLDTVVRIFENHVIVGELLESKLVHGVASHPPNARATKANLNLDAEGSQAGGYSMGFSLTVLQSECQQLICEILRATPEAASADAAAQTARLANKGPSKDKRNGSEDGLTFAFRFTDATISVPNQGADLIRQGWSRKGPNVSQEGYGSATVLPEQGIYLAASIYRPVVQFTDKIASMLPQKYSQIGNDGLLAFMENFIKDHFLPTMFVDYRKAVQQAISSPAAFRPRAAAAAVYTPSVEKGRPVLQGLLAIDLLAKEVLGWAQAMPKFASDLVKNVQTYLERTYERCRTSYMEAVLEKQSYMLIGRYDIEKLMRRDPASSCLPHSLGHSKSDMTTSVSDDESSGIESELGDLLLNLRPIRQDNLIRDDNKLILLASLSDSLEYVADSIERLGQSNMRAAKQVGEKGKTLATFADDYRKLAIDCLKVLRVEMQLETIFHLQEMTNREYLEDQDAEEPDDFIISLTAQITRRDEEMAHFVSPVKRNYIFGGICSIAASASIKVLADLKSINLFGVQQMCRNSIALEQALAAIPSINSEAVQQRLDRVRTYYELLNMPFEALLAFIAEHARLFTAAEYGNLLKVKVPGREIPVDAQARIRDVLSR
ncbi:Exocyst complex component SEC8 [Linum perenne]